MMPGTEPTSLLGSSDPSKYTFSVGWATAAAPRGMLIGFETSGLNLKFRIDAIAQHSLSRAGDDFVVGIGLELAVAGVELRPAGPFDDEEAIPLDRQSSGLELISTVP